ncbi:UspA domain-containing protein [Chondrocystis sp. NIES-4102]|nr:UspA domain-containing protein [Chondrocystis sp. NIES-4102]
MFKSCLICTDFTDGLHRFIDFVPDLAQCGLEKIVFFHSVPVWDEGGIPRIDKDKEEKAMQRLQKALVNVPSQLDIQVEVLSGKPLDTIPRVLKKHPVDVIMTGTPIRSLLQEKFIGSTSAGLAKITNQPLNIIRPQLITTYTNEELTLRCQHLWRYLLIPYNDSPTAQYLITELKKHIQNRPENSLKQCMLITVIDEYGRNAMMADERTKKAEAKLNSVKEELEALGLEVNTLVKKGDPLQEITAAALDYDISAIALATDYGKNLLQWTVRSFANDLMRSSWFPILLFSQKK